MGFSSQVLRWRYLVVTGVIGAIARLAQREGLAFFFCCPRVLRHGGSECYQLGADVASVQQSVRVADTGVAFLMSMVGAAGRWSVSRQVLPKEGEHAASVGKHSPIERGISRKRDDHHKPTGGLHD